MVFMLRPYSSLLTENLILYVHADTDESDAEPSTPSFSTQVIPKPVVAEPWGNPAQPDASTSAPTSGSSLQPASSTVWQTHWLELRIHALKQQQQRYEAKLQRLQQKGRQPAQSALPPLHAGLNPLSGSAHDHVGGSGGTAEGISPQPQSAQPDACHQAASHSLTQLPTPDLDPHPSDAVPSTSAPLGVHQQAAAAHESRPKRRHARQQMPGLAMPEIARHPFFSQHAAAEPARSGGQQLASEGGFVAVVCIVRNTCWLCKSPCLCHTRAHVTIKSWVAFVIAWL